MDNFTYENHCHSFVDIHNHKALSVILLVLIMGFITISNCLMLIGLWKTIEQFRLGQMLLFIQSSIGFLVGLISIPIRIATIVHAENSTCLLVGAQAFFSVFLNLLFALLLLGVAYIRYKKISDLQQNCRFQGNLKGITFVISYSLAGGAWNTYNSLAYHIPTLHPSFLLFLAFTSMCSTIAYSHINLRLIQFVRQSSNFSVSNQANRRRSEISCTKVILVLSTVQILCYSPTAIAWAIAGLSYFLKHQIELQYDSLVHWLHFLILLDAGLNATIYLCYSRNIKIYYKNLLYGKKIEKNNIYIIQATN